MRSSASARRRRSRRDRMGQEQRGREEAGAPPRLERDLDRLAHGELGEELGSLERSAQPSRAAPGSVPGDVVTMQAHRALGPHEPADRVHERRLAGAVRADQADDLVVADARALTPSTATLPPNRTRDVATSSAGTSSSTGGRAVAPARPAPPPSHGLDLGAPPGRPPEERIARRVPDLHEPAGEVEQEDQQSEARREQRDQLVVGEERRQPDHPHRAEDRAHRRRDAADHHHRDEQRASRRRGSSARCRGSLSTAPGEQRAAEPRDAAGERERRAASSTAPHGVAPRRCPRCRARRSWCGRCPSGAGDSRRARRPRARRGPRSSRCAATTGRSRTACPAGTTPATTVRR